MGVNYDFDASNSVHHLPYEALPDFELNFDTVFIHNQAKLTDMLSSSAIIKTGFLVSTKLREILEQFTLPLHHFYPVPMTHRDQQIEGYFWLQLPEPRLLLTEVTSAADVEAAITAVPELVSLDLLRLHRPTRFACCFISDQLRRTMEAAKITGIRFGTAKLFLSPGTHNLPNTSCTTL